MLEQIRSQRRELPPELIEKRRNRIHHHSWDYACSPERSPCSSPEIRHIKERFSPVVSPRRRSPLSISTPAMPTLVSLEKSKIDYDGSHPSSSVQQQPASNHEQTISHNHQNNNILSPESRMKKFMGESEPLAMINWRETGINNNEPTSPRSPLCLFSMQDLIVVQRMNGSMLAMPFCLLFRNFKKSTSSFTREIINVQVNNRDIDFVIVVNAQQEVSILSKEQSKQLNDHPITNTNNSGSDHSVESSFNHNNTLGSSLLSDSSSSTNNDEKSPLKKVSVESELFDLFPVNIHISPIFLNQMKLRSGQNRIRLTNQSSGDFVDGEVYLWRYDAKLVILDIDGTVKRNDGSDISYPRKGWRNEHEYLTDILHHCSQNGYKIVYQTSTRDLKISYQTRLFLNLLRFPAGPIFLYTGLTDTIINESTFGEFQDISQLQILQRLYLEAGDISLDNRASSSSFASHNNHNVKCNNGTNHHHQQQQQHNNKWSLGNIFSSKKKKNSNSTIYSDVEDPDQPYAAVFCHSDDISLYSSLGIPPHKIFSVQDKKKTLLAGKSKGWIDSKKKLETMFPRTEESFLKPTRNVSPSAR